jgi:WD40 repeat protein
MSGMWRREKRSTHCRQIFRLINITPDSHQMVSVSPPRSPTSRMFPDSSQVAVAQLGGRSVDFWDVPAFEKTRSLSHLEPVNCVAWSPDGRLLASGSAEKIRLWDVKTGEVLHASDDEGLVHCLTFSPDSKWLVSESDGERGIEIWDVETLDRVAMLTEHIEPSGDNHSLLFSPDGSLLATAGYDFRVILYHLSPCRCSIRTWGILKTSPAVIPQIPLFTTAILMIRALNRTNSAKAFPVARPSLARTLPMRDRAVPHNDSPPVQLATSPRSRSV